MMWRCWCKKWLCGYNGRYVATHTIDRNAVHTNWKSVKNGSSDYVIGWVECYLMAIEVLCIVDGIGRGVVCWVKKNDFSPRRESLRLDGLYVELRSVLWIIPTALQWAFVALLKRRVQTASSWQPTNHLPWRLAHCYFGAKAKRVTRMDFDEVKLKEIIKGEGSDRKIKLLTIHRGWGPEHSLYMCTVLAWASSDWLDLDAFLYL